MHFHYLLIHQFQRDPGWEAAANDSPFLDGVGVPSMPSFEGGGTTAESPASQQVSPLYLNGNSSVHKEQRLKLTFDNGTLKFAFAILTLRSREMKT